jgi:transposase
LASVIVAAESAGHRYSGLVVMRTLEGGIDRLEKAAMARIKMRPAFKLLLTVSGIGRILGLTIMLETGGIGRFAKVGNYASYCRCVGSEHLSNGNRYLVCAYIEVANFAVRYNPTIKRCYQRQCARTHRVVAIKTVVAHKLVRACYYILRDQVPFDVHTAVG